MKICYSCKTKKDIDNFTKNKSNKDGLHHHCRECKAKHAKNWRMSNKEYWANYHKNYQRDRLRSDLDYKLISNLRSRLYQALKNNYKAGSAVKELGCTIDEFKVYLEFKFTKEMSWDNHGEIWHIDHIRPLSNFILSNIEDFKLACHYTNLQPLIKKDNLVKGAKYATTSTKC